MERTERSIRLAEKINIKGIDVSKYQGNIDFEKVKNDGIKFVIIRAGYGKYTKQKDECFDENYKRAKAAGIPVGAYWYSYAESAEDAVNEAKACIEVIKGKKFEYPIYFDMEEQKQFAKGKAFCDSLVKAFCTELEKSGYFAGLYISRSPLQNCISEDVAERYALWVAEYADKLNYGGSYGMWQYSSKGKVKGVSGNVDMDCCYTDYPDLIKKGGFNGYKKADDPDSGEKKILDAEGLKKGDRGDGVLAYKSLIKIAAEQKIIKAELDESGGFGGGTENATNRLLKKWGYKENGIAGDKLIDKLCEDIIKKL